MRISRERMYMDIAHALAKRSTCYRSNVGAVIVSPDGWTITGTGYNGAAAGEPHCLGNRCLINLEGGCSKAVHAEINAIKRVNDWQSGQWLFTTRSPCRECASAIYNSSIIDRVYFDEPYRDSSPIEWMLSGGIEIYRITPNGMIIDPFDNSIIDVYEDS